MAQKYDILVPVIGLVNVTVEIDGSIENKSEAFNLAYEQLKQKGLKIQLIDKDKNAYNDATGDEPFVLQMQVGNFEVEDAGLVHTECMWSKQK